MTKAIKGEMSWIVESDTESLVRGLLAGSSPHVPARAQKFGSTVVRWWEGKPGDAVVMAEGGSVMDRTIAEQVLAARLEAIGYKRAHFTFEGMEKTAGWADIMAKAQRLVQSGAVTLLRNGYNNIVGHVVGDHGEYNTEIGRDDPDSQSITTWQCECPWDQYAWQRTRKWKKYEGRPCAHVMALYWQSKQTPLDDYDPDQHGPMPGQKMGPYVPPEDIPPVDPNLPRSFSPDDEGGGPPSGGGAPPPGLPPEEVAPPPMAQPGQSDVLPPAPMDQLQMQQPPIPGQTPGGMLSNPAVVSVPGAKPPSPFNPIQYPGGTYSSAPDDPPNYKKGDEKKHCGNCKMNNKGKCWGYGNKEIAADYVCDSWYHETAKESHQKTADEFVAPEIVRLKNDATGQAEGKSEAFGAGSYQTVPAGSSGEVLGQDPTTGWVEVIFPLDGGPMTPYHVKCFLEPTEIEHTKQSPPGPFIRRR